MISDPFPSIWRDYRNQHSVDDRKRFLKQMVASAYYMTLFTGDRKRRAAVMSIGNRIRRSEFCDIDRDTVYKLWSMANDVAPEFKTRIRDSDRAAKLVEAKTPSYPKDSPRFEVEVKKKRTYNVPK